ncbi:MAG: hypothetical protein J07HQW1_01482 [Haloquadratum walsbyi J07HQW1]|uniref:Uncharacterized protein n=1 Tax=Haloquadratum walsbyi J07HQW1 TaxID=1238424 RepID=U1N4Y1_9EURY|nr:MAG: hypothetical protein J07HQW1_01482 [Haloquadratum walsbyi J07HQW1]
MSFNGILYKLKSNYVVFYSIDTLIIFIYRYIESWTPVDVLPEHGSERIMGARRFLNSILYLNQWAPSLSVVSNTISLFSLHRKYLSRDSASFIDSLTSVISSFPQIPDTARREASAEVVSGVRPDRGRPSPAGTPRVAPVSSPRGAGDRRGSQPNMG